MAACLLPFSLAFSQEAESGSTGSEITIVARAEYASDPEGHLGNSALYVLADGNLSDNLSYSVSTYLLNSDPGALYSALTYSNETNMLNWAYLQYDFGRLSVSLGKDVIAWGTFENQDYDYNIYYELASEVWNGVNTYQWGGKLNFLLTDGLTLTAGLSTSPFGERFFSSGLYSCSLLGAYEGEGLYSGLLSFNAHQSPGGNVMFLSTGHKLSNDDFALWVDFNGRLSDGDFTTTTMLNFDWNFGSKWTVGAKAGFADMEEQRTYGGLILNYFPVESLRLHALAAYDTLIGSPRFNIGLTWQISL